MPGRAGCGWATFLLLTTTAFAAPWVGETHRAGDFPLVRDGRAAAIVVSAEDFKVVSIAANDLAADIERVTSRRPVVGASATGPAVLIGTLGHSALIDGLVAAGKLDVQDLRGAWESFIITTVADPFPGVPSALVIAGSDRRGTAFGVYELSQAIGVSPWYWWADVTPAKKIALSVAAGTRRFGPPSVQYRGIFLNDEDWGLQPWAAKTFEPEVGDIGPKTYAKICELLLRLKANTLWPAMHACTKAFNLYPQNKVVADDYAIVMGSSHAEPMLRNNVTEWTAPKEEYNYVTNREGVRAYWEQRLQENGRFENIYTLGMRGIHDSNMVGPKTDPERIAALEMIFADQRALIAQHARWNPSSGRVGSNVAEQNASGGRVPPDPIPQIFCAYKEVLDLYRQGLAVPDDVTLVWPDDNFGYIRNFATPEEQKRSGGFGVYYHLSYLGRPMAYLWLGTTPPALIWSEMSKAYDHGAKKIWIVNVGDLKPAEIGTEFFLQMAWDIKRWRQDNLQEFLPEWAAREFGPANAREIAGLMTDYYRLNFERRPEHLQWWLPGKPPQASPLNHAQAMDRMMSFGALWTQAEQIAPKLPAAKQDAYEQLVGYPLRGSALANHRYFYGELGLREQALAADTELRETTRRFNEELAGGKWRGFMQLEPADDDWKSMRIAPWKMPEDLPRRPPMDGAPGTNTGPAAPRQARGPELVERAAGNGVDPSKPDQDLVVPTDRFLMVHPNAAGAAWGKIPGLGLTGDAITILPMTAASTEVTRLASDAPRVSLNIKSLAAGEYTLTTYLLPTHPIVPGRGLRFAVGLDDAPPQLVVCDVKDGSPEWAQGVLNNYVTVTTKLSVPAAGRHRLQVYGVDPGVVLRKFVIGPP
ncbi:MAG: glycosyl hydrolase 115 family protein, partial [Lacunisphaera sp.]|nr:glycosyl hydrolase 115 family protein [Lacunisphaera sp.]